MKKLFVGILIAILAVTALPILAAEDGYQHISIEQFGAATGIYLSPLPFGHWNDPDAFKLTGSLKEGVTGLQVLVDDYKTNDEWQDAQSGQKFDVSKICAGQVDIRAILSDGSKVQTGASWERECEPNPPLSDGGKRPLVHEPEHTFACMTPDGLDQRAHAARWTWTATDGQTMVGDLQYFWGKELVLTYENSHPNDVFEFWTFPAGIGLDQALQVGIAGATYSGTSTVKTWNVGQEPGSCLQQAMVKATVCVNCPPEACLLSPGHYVWVHNQVVGLSSDNTPSVFLSAKDAEDSGLKYAGQECGLCAKWLVQVFSQEVWISEGSTAYDIATAINIAEGSPVKYYTNAQMAAALKALANWRKANKVSDWYSYQK